MNRDLLDANCVIQHLRDLGIILPSNALVQHLLPPDSSEYSLYFDNPNKNGDIRLEIIIRAGRYYVTKSIIRILACRHRFNADIIFTDCAV